MVQLQRTKFASFRKGVMTHSTIDNNDGRQDTNKGSGTTQDTNKTIFQVPNTRELLTIPVVGNEDVPLDVIDEEISEIMPTSADHHTSAPADYRPERVGPPVIPDYKIIQEDCNDELLASLNVTLHGL